MMLQSKSKLLLFSWLLLCVACGSKISPPATSTVVVTATPQRPPQPTGTVPLSARATPTRQLSPTAPPSLTTQLPTTATPVLATPSPWPATGTPLPTLTATLSIACSDLDNAWAAADWTLALVVLDQLETARLTCGADSWADKRYAIHINYAVTLEKQGEVQAAIEHYRAALATNGRGSEALNALIRLESLPAPTPPPCEPSQLDSYTPTSAVGWVSTAGEQLLVDGQPLTIRGVNYYPRYAAWDQFLTHSDPAEVAQELDVIAAAGINTLRIFLWYDPLFTCVPEAAVPNPVTFARLDAFIAAAYARGLHLVVTLNDLPDLIFRPLYLDWARYDAQTAFIVKRYQNEPAILAWDLRNEGDLDYAEFGREVVLDWLAHVGEVVRANDAQHLLTAGWFSNAAETASIVDVLSFHHWRTAPELVDRIEQLRANTDQPILLEEVGYPSAVNWDESEQADRLQDVLGIAEQHGLAGWMVWAAFDFPSPDPHTENVQYFYGLWRLDLSPKPALDVLSLP